MAIRDDCSSQLKATETLLEHGVNFALPGSFQYVLEEAPRIQHHQTNDHHNERDQTESHDNTVNVVQNKIAFHVDKPSQHREDELRLAQHVKPQVHDFGVRGSQHDHEVVSGGHSDP